MAFPSAVQNEINEEDAKTLVNNGCICVCEGANMPSTPKAIDVYLGAKILFGPGKSANAGGVTTSGLEMAQNAEFTSWSRDSVDSRLLGIMSDIHQSCRDAAEQYAEPGNYVAGANIAGFLKVARAMVDQGIV